MKTLDPYETIPYFDRAYSDGSPMLVTHRAMQALELFRTRLGYNDPLTMYQGCNHTGVPQSAQTHWGADVFDISAYEYERKAKLGAQLGIVVFHRQLNWDGASGMEHCHILVKGSEHFNVEAARQVTDWDNHLDGLASHSRYTGPWYPAKNFVFQADPAPQLPGFGAWPHYDKLAWGAGRTSNANLLVQAALVAHGYYAAFFGADVGKTWTKQSQQALSNYLAHHPALGSENAITEQVWQNLGTPPDQPVVSWPGTVPFKIGTKSNASLIQQALLVLNDKPALDGYTKTLGYQLTHAWRPAAVRATKQLQLAHASLKGDADGVPGPTGWLVEYRAAA